MKRLQTYSLAIDLPTDLKNGGPFNQRSLLRNSSILKPRLSSSTGLIAPTMSPLVWKSQFPDFSHSVCDVSLEAPAFIPDVIQHGHRVSPEDNLLKTKL